MLIAYIVLDPLPNLFSKKSIQIKTAIRVDSIGLPELKKKELSAKKMAAKKTKSKLASKKLRSKKPKPKTSKPKKSRSKKPKLKKPQPKPLKKSIKEIQKKQRQAMDKLEALDRIEKIKQEEKYTGAALSKGTGGEGEEVSAENFEVVQYFTSVRAHINMYWSLPQSLAEQALRAEVYTVISEKGELLERKIIRSTGNEDFDARVLETLDNASPLPVPPTEKIKKLLIDGVILKFPE